MGGSVGNRKAHLQKKKKMSASCSEAHNTAPCSEPSSRRLSSTGSFSLLSYNLYIQPPGIKNNGNAYKDDRLRLFVDDYLSRFDIVCLQEVWRSVLPFDKRQETLIKQAISKGFLYHARPGPPNVFRLKFIDGGLITLSRHPIVSHEWHPFDHGGIAIERFVTNGILYTKIQIGETFVHIFNTHLQSDQLTYHRVEGIGKSSRQLQMAELLALITKHTSQDSYPVFVLGDLNIEALNNSVQPPTTTSEYSELLAFLGARDLAAEANGGRPPVTIGDSYMNENGVRTPVDTVMTGPDDWCAMQCLDYILLLNRPELTGRDSIVDNSQSVSVHDVTVEKFLVKNQPFSILSDHYGISAVLEVQNSQS
eukprot:GILK01005674.1.p1 GENE.GILK01005674.1~~GILK01005674.1.p1  ORF type:complete len:365 (-),score=42.02 GILK01005674.1:172-1266(-)